MSLDYSRPQPNATRQIGRFAIVVLLHVLLIWALINGMARDVANAVLAPLDVSLVEEPHIPPPPPPPPPQTPPPPKVEATPPPAYVPPPEVEVAAAPVVEAVVDVAPTPPPPSTPVPSAPAPAVLSAGIVCPNFADVKQHTPYPPRAMKAGISGQVIMEFTLGADGSVSEVQVVSTSSPLFNSTATSAVSRLSCTGQGRAVRVRFPLTFRLDN